MPSNDWGVSDETFCGGTPDDDGYQRWYDLQPECPECGGDGEVPGGIAGEYERTCPRCGGSGVDEYDTSDEE